MYNIGVIPVRMGSSRFPGKPLEKICGIPLITHVYERCKMSRLCDDIFIATCDKEIFDYSLKIGANCIMTKKSHERASDRVAEASEKIEKINKKKISNIIMIQGDEPLIDGKMIDDSIKFLQEKNIGVTNIYTFIRNNHDWKNKNIVKVVSDKNDNAIYFSREPIPSSSKFSEKIRAKRQICVIGFTRQMLGKFQSLLPTQLETIESIDMNRLLESSINVKMIFTKKDPFPIDIENDIKRVTILMKKDKIYFKYKDKYE